MQYLQSTVKQSTVKWGYACNILGDYLCPKVEQTRLTVSIWAAYNNIEVWLLISDQFWTSTATFSFSEASKILPKGALEFLNAIDAYMSQRRFWEVKLGSFLFFQLILYNIYYPEGDTPG